MLRVAAGCLAIITVSLVAWAEDNGPLPVTPAPKIRQKLPQTAAYRPTFINAKGEQEQGGTAFVVKANDKLYALTAAHLNDKKEWASLKGASLHTMDDDKLAIKFKKKTVYLGRPFNEPPELKFGKEMVPDVREDFAIWELPEDSKPTVLELAEKDPRVNQWVWVVGQQEGKKLLFYRAKITMVGAGMVSYEQFDKFNPMGFSGGPVVDDQGKVVATMLGNEGKTISFGASVSTIRMRLDGLKK